ncbi:MAG: TIGR02757 family protein [Fibrobacter sp.]|nr:TIGR02757 family protein [Fibrobacter sp.]
MSDLKALLDSIYDRFHHPEYLKMDPLSCVHEFKTASDREIGGLIASVLAYGRAEIIIDHCYSVFRKIDWDTRNFIFSTSYKEKQKFFAGFKHRFNDGFDLALLLESIGNLLKHYGTLENLFIAPFRDESLTIKDALHHFTSQIKMSAESLAGHKKKSFEYLLPSPESGSACKRLNMFLRWMTRDDDSIDFGIWKKVSKSKLIIPVDTHIATLSRKLGLTSRKSADWKMAEEITAKLRLFDPQDPVKYDFSLCRAGMVDYRKEAA